MEILFTILIALVWVTGALALAVLLLPLHVRAIGEMEGFVVDGVLEALWSWGLFKVCQTPENGLECFLLGFRVYRSSGKKKVRDERPKKAGKDRSQMVPVFLEHRKTILGIMGKFLEAIGLRARIQGSMGLDSPDRTALLAQILSWVSPELLGVEVDIVPDYLNRAVDLEGTVRASIWPVYLLAVTAGLLFKRDTRQLLYALR